MRSIAFGMLLTGLICTTCISVPKTVEEVIILGADSRILPSGRTKITPEGIRYAWTGTSFRFRFAGDSCQVYFHLLPGIGHQTADTLCEHFMVSTSGSVETVVLTPSSSVIRLTGRRDSITEVVIEKRTEAMVAEGILTKIVLSPGGRLLQPPQPSSILIEAVGNSITCGYGNEGPDRDCHFSPETENGHLTYASIAARNLGAELRAICFSGRGMSRNYDGSISGTMPQLWKQFSPLDTSLAGHAPSPDWVLINLGTNDFAKGIPDSAAFVGAYERFLRQLRSAYPEAGIVCLTGSMMQGVALKTLRQWLDDLVRQHEAGGETRLFRLDLSTQGTLGYGCDWHPNVAQHEKNARELEAFLGALMISSE